MGEPDMPLHADSSQALEALDVRMDRVLVQDGEYQRYLKGWPKSVLVSSGSIPGVHRPGDEVIAVPWKRWVPRDVVEAIVAMVECGSSPC
jgi:hypothetical protein